MDELLNHRDYAMQAFDKFLAEQKTNGVMLLDIGARDESLFGSMVDRGFAYQGIDPFPYSAGGLRYAVISKGTFEAIPFAPEMFDVVFSCHAFEHCEHPVEALKEMLRVLKPGGWVFMATPFPCQHHILEADPDHIMVLLPMQLCRLLVYTGYQDVRSRVHEGVALDGDDPMQNHTIWTIGRKP